jgi:hypothetical protein
MAYIIDSGQVLGLVMRVRLDQYRQAAAVPSSVMLGYNIRDYEMQQSG